MKRKLIFTYFLITLLFSASQIINATNLTAVLIIADDYEDTELNNISESVKRDLGTMGSFINVLQKRNLFEVNKIVLKGKEATEQKVNQVLNGISPSPTDILMVYFSGHGGMDSQGTFLVTRDGKYLYRSSLESVMQSKAARLKILITDACSNDIEGIAAARSFRSSRSSMEGKFDEIYKKLFNNYKGFLSLSASTEGEYAWSDDNYGGYFTYYLVKEGLSKSPSEHWSEVFSASRQKVIQMFNRMSSEQRFELQSEGISSQTPKAYSLPVSLTGADPVIPPLPDEPNKPSTDLKPQPAEIYLKNTTQQSVHYYVEIPSADKTGLYREFDGTISPSAEISLSNFAYIYFNSGHEEVGYEVPSGSYVFKVMKSGTIDLFPEGSNIDDYSPFTKDELELILTGIWEYELPDEYVYLEFFEDGTYEIFDYEEYLIEVGYWDLYEESIEGEIYYTLKLESEEGEIDEFDFYTEDGYMLELLSLDSNESEVEFLYAVE